MIFNPSPLQMGYITPNYAIAGGATPVADTVPLLRDDVRTQNALGTMIAKQLSGRTLSATQQSNSTAYADVTELSVHTNRPGIYVFAYYLVYQTSDVSEGIGARLTFSGTASGVNYSLGAFIDLATRSNLVTANAFGTAVNPFSSGPGGTTTILRMTGSCVVEAVGDLNVQIRAETGGANFVKVLPASYVNVWGG